VAAALSWGLDVASEFMGAQVGLGYNMIVQQIYLNTAGIIALVIIYSILAIGLDQTIKSVEKRLTHWTERSKLVFG
jgi:ABC-type nitrate/sulfonate/bicarbonate transport system permease component